MAKKELDDVEMKPVDSPAQESAASTKDKDKDGDEKDKPPKDPDTQTIEDLKEFARQLEKSVSQKDSRFSLRVLRSLVTTRKQLNARVLRKVLNGFYTHSNAQRDALIAYLEEPMDTDSAGGVTVPAKPIRSAKTSQLPLLPEVDAYLHMLVLLYLLDLNKLTEAMSCSNALIQKIISQNRRSLDILAAKCYFYHFRIYELTDQLGTLKSFLHQRLRTATLRNDFEGQAVLLNCLLRFYLKSNLYDQASKLVSRSTFPELASNNEWARYLYYLGRIKAIQLEYSEAHKNLLQAIRKAPQNTAIGFKQTVHKLAITVELLLGDIPDRSLFRQTHLRRPLHPYFQLTQAVRTGNLTRFNQVLEQFGAKFQADETYTLIIRLRHNVIKTGIRMLNSSYLRISLGDVASKLCLESEEDAEFIASKAIRDGVIEATIDHENHSLQSKDTTDIYCTAEPLTAFHQRISFCLDIHNNAVKAMRYPPKSYNKELETAEERREREQQDLEYAKELAEDDDEDFM